MNPSNSTTSSLPLPPPVTEPEMSDKDPYLHHHHHHHHQLGLPHLHKIVTDRSSSYSLRFDPDRRDQITQSYSNHHHPLSHHNQRSSSSSASSAPAAYPSNLHPHHRDSAAPQTQWPASEDRPPQPYYEAYPAATTHRNDRIPIAYPDVPPFHPSSSSHQQISPRVQHHLPQRPYFVSPSSAEHLYHHQQYPPQHYRLQGHPPPGYPTYPFAGGGNPYPDDLFAAPPGAPPPFRPEMNQMIYQRPPAFRGGPPGYSGYGIYHPQQYPRMAPDPRDTHQHLRDRAGEVIQHGPGEGPSHGMFQQHHKLSPYGSPYPPEYHDYNRPNGPWIRPRDESGWVPEQPDPRVPLPPPSAIRPVPSPRENSSPVHPYPPPAEIVPDRSPDADLHPSKPIAIPPLTIASTTASTTAEALAANRRTLAAVGRDRRTPIACDTCHQRKLRCMEGDHSTREPCARCRKKGVECTWSATRLNTKRAKAAARVAEVRKQTTLIPSSASNSPSKDVGELVASGGQIRRAGSATGSAEEMRKGSTDDEYGDDEGNGVVVARRGRGSFDDGVRNMNLDGTRCAENNDEAFHAAEKNNLECSAARKNSSNKDESKKKKRKKLSERARYIAELEAKIEAYEEQLRTQQQQDASASTGGNRPTTGVDHTSSNKKRKRDSLSPAYRETSEDEPNPTAGFSANAGIGDQREMKSVPPKVFGLRMSSTYSWMNMGHTAPDSLDSPTSCDLGISPTLASHLVDVFLGCAPFHVMAINPSELKHTLKLHSKPDSVFLLHCVFAIAARFSDHPELRAIATSSGLATEMTFVWTPGGGANDPSVAPHYKRSIYHIQAHYFAQRARALLAHQLDHPTANTVTGLALLAVALYGAMDAPVAWMLVLMGIRMAKYLELERVPRDEGSSAPSSSADGSAKKSLLSKRVREAAGMVEFSRNPGWYERKKGRLIWTALVSMKVIASAYTMDPIGLDEEELLAVLPMDASIFESIPYPPPPLLSRPSWAEPAPPAADASTSFSTFVMYDDFDGLPSNVIRTMTNNERRSESGSANTEREQQQPYDPIYLSPETSQRNPYSIYAVLCLKFQKACEFLALARRFKGKASRLSGSNNSGGIKTISSNENHSPTSHRRKKSRREDDKSSDDDEYDSTDSSSTTSSASSSSIVRSQCNSSAGNKQSLARSASIPTPEPAYPSPTALPPYYGLNPDYVVESAKFAKELNEWWTSLPAYIHVVDYDRIEPPPAPIDGSPTRLPVLKLSVKSLESSSSAADKLLFDTTHTFPTTVVVVCFHLLFQHTLLQLHRPYEEALGTWNICETAATRIAQLAHILLRDNEKGYKMFYFVGMPMFEAAMLHVKIACDPTLDMHRRMHSQSAIAILKRAMASLSERWMPVVALAEQLDRAISAATTTIFPVDPPPIASNSSIPGPELNCDLMRQKRQDMMNWLTLENVSGNRRLEHLKSVIADTESALRRKMSDLPALGQGVNRGSAYVYPPGPTTSAPMSVTPLSILSARLHSGQSLAKAQLSALSESPQSTVETFTTWSHPTPPTSFPSLNHTMLPASACQGVENSSRRQQFLSAIVVTPVVTAPVVFSDDDDLSEADESAEPL